MTRTLENCTIIQKNAKKGIGEPQRFYYLNKCDGYQKSEEDDEPCEQCKRCRYLISYEGD